MTERDNATAAFILAACVPRDAWHASGTLQRAEAILAEYPEVAGSDIHTAAILGDDAAVRRFLAADLAHATAKGGPHGWDALTHLCFSNYLKLDAARSDGFVRAATALLDAGASANTGWWEPGHEPEPEWEPALYGACGVAHHADLTRLLLERGADPNDGEVVYHAPESYNLAALEVLVETGRLTDDSLTMLLIRKHDWHDRDGVKYLLEHGAKPNHAGKRGFLAIHHAIARDNDLSIIDLLLDHGADPTLLKDGQSAVARAAGRGRGDLLALFEERSIPIRLQGVERLVAACATHDIATVQRIAEREPQLMREVVAEGGRLLSLFAGTWNTEGIGILLDLGVSISARYDGDPYFDIAPQSTALHVAAWKGVASTVQLLIARGAPVNAKDGKGRTALALAVKATVDSYWTARRTPEAVGALLAAGATVEGVRYPSGYEEIDELLAVHGAR